MTGLLANIIWEPELNCLFDEYVGTTIASHCAEVGIPCPADEQFQNAKWYVPNGTAFEPEPSLNGSPAPALRVDLPGGSSFALLVGWSDVCGCGECSGAPSLRVVETKGMPPPQTTAAPPTAGEVLGATLLGLFFTVLLPLASRFVE